MTSDNARGECSAGVSESIGFLLIFTIVIIGIGLVTLYGYPMLIKQQMGADEQIMEKNMIGAAERWQKPSLQDGPLQGDLAESRRGDHSPFTIH